MKIAQFTQNKSFTIQGHWWLPKSKRKVAGDLIYDEEEMRLSLYGGLNDAVLYAPFDAKPKQTTFRIIYGESLDNVPITLFTSFYTQWNPHWKTLQWKFGTRVPLCSSILHCQRMLVGMHAPTTAHKFSKCVFEIPFLDLK